MKKFIYIPGFLDTGKSRKVSPSLDIWSQEVDFKKKLNYEYVVGHSLGANFAILNWSFNKNTKLILTNPLLRKGQIPTLVKRWFQYALTGKEKFNKSRAQVLLNPALVEKRMLELFDPDYSKILSRIPKKNIIIIRGKKDKFLCDKETARLIRRKNIKLIEVPGATHDWDDVRDEVAKIIPLNG